MPKTRDQRCQRVLNEFFRKKIDNLHFNLKKENVRGWKYARYEIIIPNKWVVNKANYNSQTRTLTWDQTLKTQDISNIQNKMSSIQDDFKEKFEPYEKKILSNMNSTSFTRIYETAVILEDNINKIIYKILVVYDKEHIPFPEEINNDSRLEYLETRNQTLTSELTHIRQQTDRYVQHMRRRVNRALNEAKDYGYQLENGRDPVQFLNFVEASIEKLAEDHILKNEDEGLLPSHIVSPDSETSTFETEMMSLGKMTLFRLKQDSTELAKMGQMIRQNLLDHRKRPRSYLGSVGDFLCRWLDSIESHTIRLVGKNPLRLEKVCLDPRIMTGFLDETAGVVSMSGTISPLDMFRDLVGLRPDSILERRESVFPKTNKKVVFLDDINTSYRILASDFDMLEKIKVKIRRIINRFDGNIALFFPSYKLLNSTLDDFNVKKPVYREYQGMNQEELMSTVESFKSERGAILAGVMGGRLSEGIDYPDTTLEMAIIVGIPYPSPGARQEALQHYYDIKFDGRGWKFAVESPAVRKLLQAAGRVVRSETDKGLIVIADNRARSFLEYIPDLEQSDDIEEDINNFFEA